MTDRLTIAFAQMNQRMGDLAANAYGPPSGAMPALSA